MGIYWEVASAGFFAAAAVVFFSYAAAPSHRVLISTACFLFGALVAWVVLKDYSYPESHPTQPYGHTYWPLATTLSGGFLALSCVYAFARIRGPRRPADAV